MVIFKVKAGYRLLICLSFPTYHYDDMSYFLNRNLTFWLTKSPLNYH